MNKYLVASQVQLLWSICRCNHLSFHFCYPRPYHLTLEWLQLSPYLSSANLSSPFCILLVILPIIPVSSVSHLLVVQGLAEVSPPHPPGLLQLLPLWGLSTFLNPPHPHEQHLLCSLSFAFILTCSLQLNSDMFRGFVCLLVSHKA